MPKTKLVEDKAAIEYRMDALVREIKKDFNPKKDHIVAVIVQPNGLFFGTNLCQRIGYPEMIVDTICVCLDESGCPLIAKDLDHDIGGKKVLIIDGAVETGMTLQFLIKQFRKRGATEVKVAVLVDKGTSRFKPDYACFQQEKGLNGYLVGYGLGYNGCYRATQCLYNLIPDN